MESECAALGLRRGGVEAALRLSAAAWGQLGGGVEAELGLHLR